MKDKNNALLWSVMAIAVLILILNIVVLANAPAPVDEKNIANMAAATVLANLPNQSAINEEIASLVKIPEFENADNKFLNIYLEREFSDEYDELEDEAYDLALEELENKDFKDLKEYLEDSIEGFDKFKNVDVKDYDVEVIELGLEDDEDKEAMVYFKVKYKYVLEEGAVEQYKDYVYVSYNVLFEEGDFSDEELSDAEYSFDKLEVFN